MAVFPQEQAYLGIAPLHGLIDVHRLGMKRIPQDAQGERARVPLLGQLGRADAAAVAVQNGGALPQERLPRRGEGHPPGIAVKELDLQLLFQGRDQPAQGQAAP